MFGNDPREMARTLAEMHGESLRATNFNQIEARQRMAEWIALDRRFDGYEPSRLLDRVEANRSNGAAWALDDPYLQRGGQKRPLSR